MRNAATPNAAIEKAFWNLLERSADLIAIVAPIFTIISYVELNCLFYNFGFSTQSIPLTLYDYLKEIFSLFIPIPLVILAFLFPFNEVEYREKFYYLLSVPIVILDVALMTIFSSYEFMNFDVIPDQTLNFILKFIFVLSSLSIAFFAGVVRYVKKMRRFHLVMIILGTMLACVVTGGAEGLIRATSVRTLHGQTIIVATETGEVKGYLIASLEHGYVIYESGSSTAEYVPIERIQRVRFADR